MTEDTPIFDGMIWRSILPLSEGDPKEPSANITGLTQRQLTLAELVARGMSADEISAVLKISPETVKKRKGSLYRKMGVESELEMTLQAINIGLLNTADLVPADFDPSVFGNLTPRQREVAELIALRGFANKEIACELSLSEYTVKDLVSLVFEKTKTFQRIDLAVGFLEAKRRTESAVSSDEVRAAEMQVFPAVTN